MTDAARRPPLDVLVTEARGEILLFGITPPKASTPAADRRRIAELTLQRLAPVDLDGLILYDIDDESDRAGGDRPFPYLPTSDPAEFSAEHLTGWTKPVVVYRSVGKYDADQLTGWLDSLDPRRQLGVFVGPSTSTKQVRTTLADAHDLRRTRRPELTLGGVMITERHAARGDEHDRMLRKQQAGCAFFVSQVIYDVDRTKSVVSDYFYACREQQVAPRPLVFTLAVCGSTTTLAFLQWLGVEVPRWLQNELVHATDPLAVSHEQCLAGAQELAAFCRRLGVPYGFNVESVSIRRTEIEAAVDLAGRLRPLLA